MICKDKSSTIFSKTERNLKRHNDASRLETDTKKNRVYDKIEKSQGLQRVIQKAHNRKQNKYRFYGKPLPSKLELEKFFMDSDEDISGKTSKENSTPNKTSPNLSLSPTSAKKYADELLKLLKDFELSQPMTLLKNLENPPNLHTNCYTQYHNIKENQISRKKIKSSSSSSASYNCLNNDDKIHESYNLPENKQNNVNGNKSSIIEKDTRYDVNLNCFIAQYLCNTEKLKNNTKANSNIGNLLTVANKFISCNSLDGDKLGNELLSPKFKYSMNPAHKNNIETSKTPIPKLSITIEPKNDNSYLDNSNIVVNCEPIVFNESAPLNRTLEDVCLKICEKVTSNNFSFAPDISEKLSKNNKVNEDSMCNKETRKSIPKISIINPNCLLSDEVSLNADINQTFGRKNLTDNTLNECFVIPNNKTAVINNDIRSNIDTEKDGARFKEMLYCVQSQEEYSCQYNLSKFKSNTQANDRVSKLLTTAKTSISFNVPELLISELKYSMVPTTKNHIRLNEVSISYDNPYECPDNDINYIENCENFGKGCIKFDKDVNEISPKFNEKVIESEYFSCSDVEMIDKCNKKNNNSNMMCDKNITTNISQKNFGNSIISPHGNENLNTNINVTTNENMSGSINLPKNNYNIPSIKIKDEIINCDTNTETLDSTSKVKETNLKCGIKKENMISKLSEQNADTELNNINNDLNNQYCFHLPVIKKENKYYQPLNENSATPNNFEYDSYVTESSCKDIIINEDVVTSSINIERDDYKYSETFKNINEISLEVGKKIMKPICLSYDDSRNIIEDINLSKNNRTIMGTEITNNLKSNNNNIVAQHDISKIDFKISEVATANNYSGDDIKIIDETTKIAYINERKIYNKNKNKHISKSVKYTSNSSVATGKKFNIIDKNKTDFIDVNRIVFENRSLINVLKNSRSDLEPISSHTSSIINKKDCDITEKVNNTLLEVGDIISENKSLKNVKTNTKNDLHTISDYTIGSPIMLRKQFNTTDKKINHIDLDAIISENKTLINLYKKQKSLGFI